MDDQGNRRLQGYSRTSGGIIDRDGQYAVDRGDSALLTMTFPHLCLVPVLSRWDTIK
jgi:hypothetical protein